MIVRTLLAVSLPLLILADALSAAASNMSQSNNTNQTLIANNSSNVTFAYDLGQICELVCQNSSSLNSTFFKTTYYNGTLFNASSLNSTEFSNITNSSSQFASKDLWTLCGCNTSWTNTTNTTNTTSPDEASEEGEPIRISLFHWWEPKPNTSLTWILLGDWGKGGMSNTAGSAMPGEYKNENDDDNNTSIYRMGDLGDDDDQLTRRILKDNDNNNNNNKNNNNNNNNQKNGGGKKKEKKMNQVPVARAMGAFASHAEPSFVVALGDNFYSNGVYSATDALWTTLWQGNSIN
jgi:hypothetical protein